MATGEVLGVQEASAPMDEQALRVKIREEERAAAKTLLEAWQADDLVELEKKLEIKMREETKKAVDQWMDAQKPPSRDQIQAMLDQEYATFSLKINAPTQENDSGDMTTYEFTLTELPQSAERKFYRQFKENLMKNANQINAWVQKSLDKTFDEKAQAFLETIDGAFDMLAETVVIVLNPRGKKQFVTKDWVQENISSIRQWNIVQAQVDANRLRDFFSRLSQSGQTIQMMTGNLSTQRFRPSAQ